VASEAAESGQPDAKVAKGTAKVRKKIRTRILKNPFESFFGSPFATFAKPLRLLRPCPQVFKQPPTQAQR
jgi:hypothetical protein